MRRRRMRKGLLAAGPPGADSLMDLLACTVGVLLLVVLLAVLEFRGNSFRLVMPYAEEPPAGRPRMLLLCQQGRVRFYDSDRCLDRLLEGFDKVRTYQGLNAWVRQANAREVKDPNFVYGFNYTPPEFFWGYLIRYPVLELVIKERPGYMGETLEEFAEPESVLKRQLAAENPEHLWVSCAVDEESIELFRTIRQYCLEEGFLVGWDPGDFEFPICIDLMRRYQSQQYAPSPSFSKRQ